MAASLRLYEMLQSFDYCNSYCSEESKTTSDGTEMGISGHDSHHLDMLHQQDNFRHSSIFCDVDLICEDGTSLKAHRNVLAASSPYFKAMFSGGLAEEGQPQVPIHGVSSAALKMLVDCVYTGRMEKLCQGNVGDVAAAANMLQITTAEALCTKFMSRHLDKSNAIGVHRFATSCNYTKLANWASRFIEDNLDAVSTSEEFMDLSKEDLPQYLMSSKINCNREGKVLRAVIGWIEKSIGERRIYAHELLKYVKVAMIPYLSTFCDAICNDAALKSILKCKFEGARKNSSGESEVKVKSGMTTVIYIVGGMEYGERPQKPGRDVTFSKTVWFLNTGHGKWYKSEGEWSSEDHYYHPSIAAIGSTLYLVGGRGGNRNVLDLYEFYSTSGEAWFKGQGRLEVGRSDFGLQELNGCLYAFGGRDRNYTPLGSIEKLDPKNGHWHVIGHMPKAMYSMGVVSYGGLIYVVGGWDDSCDNLNGLMSYNPVTKQWNTLPSWLNPRSDMGVAVLDDHLYVVGGYVADIDDCLPSDAVDRYSFERNEWEKITLMKRGVAKPGVAAANGCLFVLGGDVIGANGLLEATSDVVYYNPKTCEWKSGISMPTLRGLFFPRYISLLSYPPYSCTTPVQRSKLWQVELGRNEHTMASCSGDINCTDEATTASGKQREVDSFNGNNGLEESSHNGMPGEVTATSEKHEMDSFSCNESIDRSSHGDKINESYCGSDAAEDWAAQEYVFEHVCTAPSHFSQLLGQLDGFRSSSLFCDAELIADDGTSIKAHQALLVAASPYFRAMFSGGPPEETQPQVEIGGVPSAVLKILVDSVYTGQLKLSQAIMSEK